MNKPHPHLQEAPKIQPAKGKRLDSWKEIAGYLKRDVRTVQRWEGAEGLPVYRLQQGRIKHSPVYAFTSEIDAWLHKNPPRPTEGVEPNRIVVAAFENRTGNDSLGGLGRRIADSINSVLIMHVKEVKVAASPAGSGSMEFRRLAALAKSGLVVSGAYYLRDGQVELQAKIVDPWVENNILCAFEPILGPAPDPVNAIDLLCRRVAGALALHFTPQCDLGAMTPPLLDAFREFQAGRQFFDSDYEKAFKHFEKALALDPEFCYPRFLMYSGYRNQGMWEQAESQLAMLEANQGRMTIYERLMIRNWHADLEGRLPEMLAIQRDLAPRVPKYRIAVYLQGLFAIWVNRPREAIEVLKTIPVDWLPMCNVRAWPTRELALAHHLAGDFEGQLRIAKERMVHFPDILHIYSHQAMALSALGCLEEVDRVIDSCLTIPAQPMSGTPVSVMEDAAYELRAHGYRDKALAVGKRALSWIRSRPPEELQRWSFELGRALYITEQWQEAKQIFEELAGKSPQKIEYQGYLGSLAVHLGDRAGAERIAESLGALDGRYRFGLHTYCRARIASLLGEKEKAVELLRAAFAQGYRFSISVHRDPDFEPLRDYPPYQELIRSKG